MTPIQYKKIANTLSTELKHLIRDMISHVDCEAEKEYRNLITRRINNIGVYIVTKSILPCDDFGYKEEGGSRMVFISKSHEFVIKVNKNVSSFGNQNWKEWSRWNKYKRTIYGHILAPCLAISDNKSILLQTKVKPCRRLPIRTDDMNYKIYSVLTDDGVQSGVCNGKVVIYDYGY